MSAVSFGLFFIMETRSQKKNIVIKEENIIQTRSRSKKNVSVAIKAELIENQHKKILNPPKKAVKRKFKTEENCEEPPTKKKYVLDVHLDIDPHIDVIVNIHREQK